MDGKDKGKKINKLRIATLNVRGLNKEQKRITIFKWLDDNEIDIALLQETYCVENFISNFKRNWKGKMFHSPSNSKHAKGVCILFRKELCVDVVNFYKDDDDGRKILLNVDVDGTNFTIVNVYCPNFPNEREEFINNIKSWVGKVKIVT